MSNVAFMVHGIPAPQGSKTPWGSETNPRTKPWRGMVSADAAEAMKGREPLAGPLRLEVHFFFPRPKAHYGTGRNAEKLKPSAPLWHCHKPDLDKLLRAIGDALSGIVFRDDSQIVEVIADKVYQSPGALIFVGPPDPEGSQDV
jgi:Holliday junction resolvase RusA-like endonuclease